MNNKLLVIKILLKYIKTYITNIIIFITLKFLYYLTSRDYTFIHSDDEYKIKLNQQNLEMLLYLYSSELNMGENYIIGLSLDDKLDDLRDKFMEKMNLKNKGLLLVNDEVIIISHSRNT